MKKVIKILQALTVVVILVMPTVSVFASEIDVILPDANSYDLIENFDINKIESFTPSQDFIQKVEVVDILDMQPESIDFMQKKESAAQNRSLNKISYSHAIDTVIEDAQSLQRDEHETITSFSATNNTNPNNAFLLSLNESMYGNITAQGEQRWYAAEINQNSKLTTTLLMTQNVDFDLAIFKLDLSTMTLNYISESYQGVGEPEVIDLLINSGIYYFLVVSYTGTGLFEITAYTSTFDLQYEINDGLSIATPVSSNEFTVNGIIDNPFDYDFYKFTLTGTRMSTFNFSKPTGTNYQLYLFLNGTSVYQLDSGVQYNIPAGTHYIVVFSQDNTHSNSSFYTVKLTSQIFIPGLATYLSTSNGINTMQMTSDGKTFYVNGNLINFTWSYTGRVNNSAGYINTYMNLYQKSTQYVAMVESDLYPINNDGQLPYFANYTTTFEGGGSAHPALILTLVGTDFTVNRYAGGAYANEAISYSVPYTQVVINVNTGRIIDVTFYNFYYYFGHRTYTANYVPTVYHYNTKQ